MKKLHYVWRGLIDAAGATVYSAGIAALMFNGDKLFGDAKNFLIPLFMLLLLMISATVTGGLVLGKPLLLYIDGEKKEAVRLFLVTLGWLALFALIMTGIVIK